ncbi:MAG: PRC-barrel domain-containing protein [Rhizomicrobium sp.]
MTTAETITESETKHHALLASDRVEGAVVRRLSGERVGSIQRLMIDKVSGHVAYAVLRFGGFLGMGEKHLPIPWERLKFDMTRQAYLVSLTDAELAKAPFYAAGEEFDWGDRKSEITLHNYYGARPCWSL